jgi:hypothetical protein
VAEPHFRVRPRRLAVDPPATEGAR